VCPSCTGESHIFPSSTGGAKKMAEDMQVPFLGQIPLDPRLAQCCDEGKNFFELFPEAAPSLAYMSVVKGIYIFHIES